MDKLLLEAGMKKKRYYLHGDQKDACPGIFYCASCDLFVPSCHFDGYNGNETMLHEGKFNFRHYIRPDSNWQRPDDAVNLFECVQA